MSRKQGQENNSGKDYDEIEIQFVSFCLIRSISIERIASSIDRTVDEIRKLWWRICHNASAYRDKTIFNLKPFTKKSYTRINGYAKEYIRCQLFVVKEKSNIPELSRRLGISPEIIRNYVKKIQGIKRTKIISLLEME